MNDLKMAETISENTQNLCNICENNQKKYCCPRCDIFYCSLDCYKSEKHTECSESFYKECVNNELSSLNVDNESKQKMIDILNRMSKQDESDPEDNDLGQHDDDEESIDSDDEAGLSLEERIKDLNLDDPDALWKVLTTDEKNEFEALINKGDVGSLIPQWEPWWTFSKTEKLVEEVDKKNDDEENALKKCPQLLKVPQFSALTTVIPSPAIRNNIVNVLASYALIMRYFNGVVVPLESTAYLFSVCGNLDSNVNYEDLATSVEAVAQMCLQTDLIETDVSSLDVMRRDTFLILQGPSEKNKLYYCKAALSHLHKILSDAKTEGKTLGTNTFRTDKDKSEFSTKFPDHNREHLPKFDSRKIKKCLRKLEYYLSFVESHGMDFE